MRLEYTCSDRRRGTARSPCCCWRQRRHGWSAAKPRWVGGEALEPAYRTPPLLLVSQRQAKKSATLPPLVKPRLKSKSFAVRPPSGPEEENVPLVLATSGFCSNSTSMDESPLVLARSAATITQTWPWESVEV